MPQMYPNFSIVMLSFVKIIQKMPIYVAFNKKRHYQDTAATASITWKCVSQKQIETDTIHSPCVFN